MRHPIIRAAFVVAVSLAPAATYAADLKPVYKAPPPVVAVYNWTGFYIGGNAGWYEIDTNMVSAPANAATAGFNAACIAAGACPQAYGSSSASGFIGGVQAGYNWQVQNWVLGVEADIAWTGKDATQSVAVTTGGFFPFAGSHVTSQDWLGTVRGRAGVLFTPQFLVYGTGGFAFAKVDRTYNAAFPTFVSTWSGSSSDTLTGWTLGAGIEWALGNGWSIGAEYLYVKLDGGDNFLTSVQGGACNGTNCTFTITPSDITENIIRAKLNYKFGYSKAPVVAKY